MSDVDPRLVAALRDQLARRPDGARRVGWKLGAGDRERIGNEIAVGHLTSATVLDDGSKYRGDGDLHADVEVAVELRDEGAIAGYGVALEIVDLADGETPEEVVAGNVFHRAVAFGPFAAEQPQDAEGVLVANGERRAAAPAPTDVAERVAAARRVLAAAGEGLQPGDRLITGLIVNTAVESGDLIVAELGALGRVSLRIA